MSSRTSTNLNNSPLSSNSAVANEDSSKAQTIPNFTASTPAMNLNPLDPASDAASFTTLVSDAGSTTTLVPHPPSPPTTKRSKRSKTHPSHPRHRSQSHSNKDYEAAAAELISTYGFGGRAPVMSVPSPGLGTNSGTREASSSANLANRRNDRRNDDGKSGSLKDSVIKKVMGKSK